MPGSINYFVGVRWATVAAVGALAVGAATVPLVTGDGSGPATAHLWMDTNGGTCVRDSDQGEYADATACDSFDEACEASSPGDTVRLVDSSAFTTAEGAVVCDNGGAGPAVVFDAGTGVTVAGMDLATTNYLTFKDFTVTDPAFAGGANNKIVDVKGADNITFENVDIDRAWKNGDGLGITRDVDDFTFRDGDICCAKETKLVQIQQFSGGGHTDLLFENVNVHDTVYANNPIVGDPHFECWWFDAVNRITLRNVKTWNCGASGNIFDDTGTITDLLFTNTVWEAKRGGTSMVDVIPGSDTGYLGNDNATVIDGNPASGSTGVIEYSIIEGDIIYGAGWNTFVYRGNVTKFQTCGDGSFTYVSNLHTGADCSASDIDLSTALNTGNFVDDAGHDWRPSSCSAPQIDAGTTSSYPATDADGVSRYSGDAPDAGPYEGACP